MLWLTPGEPSSTNHLDFSYMTCEHFKFLALFFPGSLRVGSHHKPTNTKSDRCCLRHGPAAVFLGIKRRRRFSPSPQDKRERFVRLAGSSRLCQGREL